MEEFYVIKLNMSDSEAKRWRGGSSDHGHGGHRGGRRGGRGSGRGGGRGSGRGGGRGGGRGRGHPPHLKGREIGLYYANIGKRNREKRELKPLGTVLLSDQKKMQISALIEECNKGQSQFITMNNTKFKQKFLELVNGNIHDKLQEAPPLKPNLTLDEKYHKEFLAKQQDWQYKMMQKKRMKLPSFDMKDEILLTVNSNQVSVISGETGCGKTTQVAQFILDDYLKKKSGSLCTIVCTQPRRISAIAVASRIADERAEKLGESVGYHIRLERNLPREKASITFCTTGILLKQMERDPTLHGISHLILDEIHERDIMSDFLITLLKKVIVKRKDLKVILMSATLDSEKFSRYYNNCIHITIPGFTYHVQEYYLEDVLERTKFQFEDAGAPGGSNRFKHVRDKRRNDREYVEMIEPHIRKMEHDKVYSKLVCNQLRNPASESLNLELILALLIDICAKEKESGAILVFLPGFADISNLHGLIQKNSNFPQNKFLILPLHSQMPTVDQKVIFETPPNNIRKIILSTNIAETSITIDDVVFVIDCGRIKKQSFFVDSNVQTLLPEWVTLANANQRKGRAGRVKPGVCFHLYSRVREMMLDKHQKPEILRTRLESVILMIKILQLGKADDFLKALMDKPDDRTIEHSIRFLQRLNALDEEENLTPLGLHLAKLPVNPQIGKMLLLGAIFSCLDPILSVAASLDFKDAFQLPLGMERQVTEKKLDLANGLKSDHLLLHEALLRYEEEGSNAKNFCRKYFLSFHTMKLLLNMKTQFMEYLHELNFVPDKDPKSKVCNRNSDNVSLIKAIICAGLYPNVAIQRAKKYRNVFHTLNQERLELHPKSILAKEVSFESPLVVYYLRIKSTADFMHDATIVHPLPLIFFGDRFSSTMDNGVNCMVISDQLKFKCSESTMALVTELRKRLNWFLEFKVSNPGVVDWTSGTPEIHILVAIMELITSEDMGDIDLDAYDDVD